MPHIIVGTAGHIDHGKTALVELLTGVDADRLKEEKERGITIDIGLRISTWMNRRGWALSMCPVTKSSSRTCLPVLAASMS